MVYFKLISPAEQKVRYRRENSWKKPELTSTRNSISNFRKASSAGKQAIISKAHFGARCVNKRKLRFYKRQFMQLMRGSQANPSWRDDNEVGTWRESGNMEVWILGKKKQECLHLGDTKYTRLSASSLYSMMTVDRVRTS